MAVVLGPTQIQPSQLLPLCCQTITVLWLAQMNSHTHTILENQEWWCTTNHSGCMSSLCLPSPPIYFSPLISQLFLLSSLLSLIFSLIFIVFLIFFSPIACLLLLSIFPHLSSTYLFCTWMLCSNTPSLTYFSIGFEFNSFETLNNFVWIKGGNVHIQTLVIGGLVIWLMISDPKRFLLFTHNYNYWLSRERDIEDTLIIPSLFGVIK